MKKLLNALAAIIICLYSSGQNDKSGILLKQYEMPMIEETDESAYTRWLNKEILDSRLLDNMESTERWKLDGRGEMLLSGDSFKDGSHSLRMVTMSRFPDDVSPSNQRNYGVTGLTRYFDGEDWSSFNRLSIWIRPYLPGWETATVRVFLYNEGKIRIPGGAYPVYQAAQDMKNNEWNHIVWEITDLPRDSVTRVKVEVRRQGNEPGASDTLIFDIDQLELQKVIPDKYEGWDVAGGRIAFSHTGYQPGAVKQAFTSNHTAADFSIVEQNTGKRVLTKPVQSVKSRIGEFQVLDFSEIQEPGKYIIQFGKTLSKPFTIDNNIWDQTIRKAINFFYTERCGTAIPGIHDVCHRDWRVEHEGRHIVINGGWHDAGDLSQGLVNTAEAVYAMFSLAEKIKLTRGKDILYDRLIEEAKWGLDWVNKTSFHDGYRCTWATMGFWSDDIIGNNDDIVARASNNAHENFLAAAAEAIASRILEGSDPDLARKNLKQAAEDFRFGLAAMKNRGSVVESASAGILAAADLYRITGLKYFMEEAKNLAKLITDSQQRSVIPGLRYPITGFFYTSPAKTTFQYYTHRGHEQAAIVALSEMCELFPDDPDWIVWYSSVVLHSEYYQKNMSVFTEPFSMLPNSIHKGDEYLKAKENLRGNVQQQILNGFDIGGNWHLRVYPVQPEGAFRGNYGTMLSQAKAVSAAAHLRRSEQLAKLAEEQLYWVVGRNPFGQSTMYGEGYDYQQQYSAMSGDIVGSLPVGMKSRENFDLPYWPAHNHPNYKEVWVHPVTRWLSLMADLAGPATVEVKSDNSVEFHDTRTGSAFSARPDAGGEISIKVPEGSYNIKSSDIFKKTVLLSSSYTVFDLTNTSLSDIILTAKANKSGNITIKSTITGKGNHSFRLLSSNLSVSEPEKKLNLDSGNEIKWNGKIINRDEPWIAVVVADGNIQERHEINGLLVQFEK